MDNDTTKLPRLYTTHDLGETASVPLEPGQAHYLRSVMRRQDGEAVRVFNGRDGEWTGTLSELGKKSGTLTLNEKIKDQPADIASIHLLFAPLKKNRMDIVIEKATELGVTDFRPIITDRTEVRKIKTERITAQIIESSEQCERMSIPTLHAPVTLHESVNAWQGVEPILWGWERGDVTHLSTIAQKDWAFLIGPVGGFSTDEEKFLSAHKHVKPMSLGQTVFRAETASIVCLTHARLHNDGKG